MFSFCPCFLCCTTIFKKNVVILTSWVLTTADLARRSPMVVVSSPRSVTRASANLSINFFFLDPLLPLDFFLSSQDNGLFLTSVWIPIFCTSNPLFYTDRIKRPFVLNGNRSHKQIVVFFSDSARFKT